MNSRIQRVSERVQQELAKALLQIHEEPLFLKTTITSVKVSSDLSNAKVFISIWDEKDIEETMAALQKRAKPLRHILAKTLNLRLTPALTFIYDTTAMHAQKITELINQLDKNEK